MRFPRFSFSRSDDEKMLNVGEPVIVGGCYKKPRPKDKRPPKKNIIGEKKIVIHEPSLRATGELVVRAITMMQTMADDEKEWVDKVVKNPSLIRVKDLATFKPILALLEDELSRVVEEDLEYVREEMSPRQATEVGARWLKVIGFERIRDLFFQMQVEFQKVMPSTPDRNAVPTVDIDEALSEKQ